ncbi:MULTISPECIES: DNA-binding protein [Acinetobacter]|jgi:hypothetical protein|uniref:DNA-binding protein n=1 Tax=Acinetobacter TaxID=469 RepID=UPI000B3D4709|nr:MULTISPECIES: DNA-binding protein [Acinetobacter]AXY60228.1 DNA-binding protein [Acinetobacter sp. WCHAc010052]WOE40110.1 DNA-binding protein [Acinetobacter chinensis]
MALINLSDKSENEKQELLDQFIKAPDEQKFGQEIVALYLGCSTWTLARMRCDDSSLQYTKIGRRIAYKKSHVLEFEKSRTVTCTAQYT